MRRYDGWVEDVVRRCWCGADALQQFGAGYMRCASCETLVAQAGLSDHETRVVDDDRDFYGRRYWFEHQTDELGLPDIHTRARADLPERCVDWLKSLLRHRLPPARILEVGAGHGAYTALLQSAGFDATALDLSKSTAEFARERFDVRYLVGPVEDQDLDAASFDVVVANDVLEHLASPRSSVAAWVRLLKPNGLFIFQTPEYVPSRTYDDLLRIGDPFLLHIERAGDEHLYLFSRVAVRRLLSEFGLCHVDFAEPVYPYDMFGFASGEPLRVQDKDPGAILGAGRTGPLVLALLDARDAWRTSERDRAARLDVIERLDAQLGEATSGNARCQRFRFS